MAEIPKSLYSQYLVEKTEDRIIETDYGFATYRFLNDQKAVYIIDLYVIPKFRKSGMAKAMADIIVEEARSKGFFKLLGSVVPSNKSSTSSLKVLLAYGMVLESASADFIVFRKDI